MPLAAHPIVGGARRVLLAQNTLSNPEVASVAELANRIVEPPNAVPFTLLLTHDVCIALAPFLPLSFALSLLLPFFVLA